MTALPCLALALGLNDTVSIYDLPTVLYLINSLETIKKRIHIATHSFLWSMKSSRSWTKHVLGHH